MTKRKDIPPPANIELVEPRSEGVYEIDLTTDAEQRVSNLLYTVWDASGLNRDDAAAPAGIKGATLTFYINGKRNVLVWRMAQLLDGLGYDVSLRVTRRKKRADR